MLFLFFTLDSCFCHPIWPFSFTKGIHGRFRFCFWSRSGPTQHVGHRHASNNLLRRNIFNFFIILPQKRIQQNAAPIFSLVGTTRLELATSGVTGSFRRTCSSHFSLLQSINRRFSRKKNHTKPQNIPVLSKVIPLIQRSSTVHVFN